MRAFIPASSVVRVGIIRFIPKETSCLGLYQKLSSYSEIISVRRFMKKIDNELVPLTTISVTFVGTRLPQHIYLDKVCRNVQVCSMCA
ncbi:unnamed protein product [Chilo suppressalis]|uniref:Uncharacterized protein n=1 Tax=Chilo suppressalis TaxID=168631 RepID=A0ABN8BC09_CHISP|nr:unnamed protein product [Chilo suppressalis]